MKLEEHQKKFIIKNYKTKQYKDIAKELGVGVLVVKSFINYNKLRKNDEIEKQKQERVEFVRANFDKMTNFEMAAALGVHVSSISNYLKQIGKGRPHLGRKDFLTKEQIDYITEHYAKDGTQAIADHLGLKMRKVQDFAWRKGLRKSKVGGRITCKNVISNEHKEFIIAHYKEMTYEQMSEKTGIRWYTIKSYCNRHKMSKKKRGDVSESAQKYIVENYKVKSNIEMSKVLGISDTTVGNILKRLGLKREKQVRPSMTREQSLKRRREHRKVIATDEQNEYISKNYQSMSNAEIGEQLGITAGRVAFFLRKLGIKRETKRERRHSEKLRMDDLRRKVKTKRRNYTFTPDKRLIELCGGESNKIDFGECIGNRCYCYGSFTCKKKQDRCLV